jgi:hypothetical protein
MEKQKTPDLSAELTLREVETYAAKAEELAKFHNVPKVHPVVQIDKDNGYARAVCYLKEPNYTTKIRLMDKATTSGVYSAGEELRELCVIKEASDPITYSDAPESDAYKMGVVDYAINMVRRLQNQFKKK